MKLEFEYEVEDEVQLSEDEVDDIKEEVWEVIGNRIDSIMKGRE